MAARLPRRILLTGGTGSLGRAILEFLVDHRGSRVLALRRRGGRRLPELPSVREHTVNFASPASLANAFASFRPDAVIHAAATGMEIPRPPLLTLVDANVMLPLRLLQAASRIRGLHFVMVGTGLAYRDQGRPLREEDPLGTVHPYAATKAAADLLLRSAAPALGVRLTVLRPFSFTGPGDEGTRLFPSILRAAEVGKRISLTGGRQVRDFLSSRDVAAGVLAALRHPPASPAKPAVYNLGSGQALALRQVISKVVRQLGLHVKLGFGERTTDPREPPFLVADIRQAVRDLDWGPREGLAHAVWRLARSSFPGLELREPGCHPRD